MRHHGRIAGLPRYPHRLQRLGQRPDLVHLHQDRVGHSLIDAPPKSLRIRHEQIVADELDPFAEPVGEDLPAAPVLLGHAVLDGKDRIPVGQVRPVGRELVRRECASLVLQHVAPVRPELAGGGVERDPDLGTRLVPGAADALDQRLERLLVGAEVRGEPALVPDRGAHAPAVEPALQGVEHLRADPQRVREPLGAHWHHHELLEVDAVVGMCAAVQHVHHRHRQDPRLLAADVPVERHALLVGGGLGDRERHPQDRVRAQTRLVRGAVELDQGLVDRGLIGGIEADHGLCDLTVHVRDRLRHALSGPGLVAVAQFHRLELAGRGARGHRRPAVAARAHPHIDLDRRVSPGIQDLPARDGADLAHPALPSPGGRKRSAQRRSAISGSTSRAPASSTHANSNSPTRS